MINLAECHFIYNDINSRKYNLIIANIDTNRFQPIVGYKKGAFLFNRAQKATELMGDNYQDTPLSIDIEIVTCGQKHLDRQTIHDVERWLFTNSIFRRLFIDIEDDPYGETYEMIDGVMRRLYFNCRFINPEKIESHGGVIGFRCTLETDSMMLWQEEISHAERFNSSIKIVDGTETRTIIKGDVNMDGIVDLTDSQLIMEVYTNIVTGIDPKIAMGLTDDQYIACDFDYDASKYEADMAQYGEPRPDVELEDAQMALRIYTSTLVEFPENLSTIELVDGVPQIVEDENTKIFDIYVDSDIDGYTYPTITLRTGNVGGEVIIQNEQDTMMNGVGSSEQRVTKFSSLPANKSIIINSKNNYISPENLYEKMTGANFPRLVEGVNHFNVSGDIIEFNISWQNRRFL